MYVELRITKLAYGAVCYLHVVDLQDNLRCSLLMSKSYFALKNETTIPRLELLAAVVAVDRPSY